MFDTRVATQPTGSGTGLGAEAALSGVVAGRRGLPAQLVAWQQQVDDPDVADPLAVSVFDPEPVAADGQPASHAVDGPDGLALAARYQPPGPATAALLGRIRVGGLSPAGRLDYLMAQQRLAAWVEALAMPVLTDHAGLRARRNHPYDERQRDRYYEQVGAVSELAAELKVSERTLGRRLATARELVGRLPATLAALRSGHLTATHARAMVELVGDCADEVAGAVEQRVVPGCVRRGGAGTPSSFRRSVRTALTAVDADALSERHAAAAAGRSIDWLPLPDGMAALTVTSTAADIELVMRTLTALAGPRDAADPRTLDNRRIDSLVGLCAGRLDHAAGPDAPAALPPASRPDVQAQVVIDLPTLLGLAENPARLRGYGEIPAGVARDWLRDASTWRRLVTDPVTGHLLDYGPQVRLAPGALRSFVVARDATCTFPGCTAPASGCDIDHRVPHREDGSGGSTSAENCDALCRRHHNLKTTGHWQVVASHPDRVIWRSPNGRLHTRHRPPVLAELPTTRGEVHRCLAHEVEVPGAFHRSPPARGRTRKRRG